MERLTRCHFVKSDGYYMKCSETCGIDCGEKSYCEEVDNIVDRLGAVEDILGDEYDLDHLRNLVEVDQKKGQPVWVVERNKIEEPCEVGGYVFIALVDGVALVHPYIGGCGDIDDILYDCLEETAEDMHCDLSAFPIEDCYLSKEAAELALKGER